MSRRTGLTLATGAALVLIVAILGSLITDESEPQALPEPADPQAIPEPAGNGLIAYSYEGDIYVGDPTTGETTAIVTHFEYEAAHLTHGATEQPTVARLICLSVRRRASGERATKALGSRVAFPRVALRAHARQIGGAAPC